ncbi:MAG: hypothetical protein COA79_23015 [Planctomycetota bacterium]|nr:MAG: hypothetical protein COA79_23015 [Planctomycetota bacterium]
MNNSILLKLILILIIINICGCTGKSKMDRSTSIKIIYANTQEYKDEVKHFLVDVVGASEQYGKWYIKRFNIKDASNVKGHHPFLYNKSYFFYYAFNKKYKGIPLVGVLVDSSNAVVTEINLNFNVVRTKKRFELVKSGN